MTMVASLLLLSASALEPANVPGRLLDLAPSVRHAVCLHYLDGYSIVADRPSPAWFVVASTPLPSPYSDRTPTGEVATVSVSGGRYRTVVSGLDSAGCANFSVDANATWTFAVLGGAPTVTLLPGISQPVKA